MYRKCKHDEYHTHQVLYQFFTTFGFNFSKPNFFDSLCLRVCFNHSFIQYLYYSSFFFFFFGCGFFIPWIKLHQVVVVFYAFFFEIKKRNNNCWLRYNKVQRVGDEKRDEIVSHHTLSHDSFDGEREKRERTTSPHKTCSDHSDF